MRTINMTKSTSQQKVPKVFQMPPLGSLDLYEVTIKDLQQYMSSCQLSSHDYVTYCLERIRVVRLPSYMTDFNSRRESLSMFYFCVVPGKPLPRSGHRSEP